MEDLKTMCRGCQYCVKISKNKTGCANPDMNRLDIAEAINETFFGGACKGYEAK